MLIFVCGIWCLSAHRGYCLGIRYSDYMSNSIFKQNDGIKSVFVKLAHDLIFDCSVTIFCVNIYIYSFILNL